MWPSCLAQGMPASCSLPPLPSYSLATARQCITDPSPGMTCIGCDTAPCLWTVYEAADRVFINVSAWTHGWMCASRLDVCMAG